jgi:3-oxoadipate enol-lactonase
MPKAPINGIELYYESHGEGPAIVFAHGRGGNHLSWWQQVPVFSKNYRCITFDHRGWGASLEAPGGPERKAFVEDLKQLLDHLGVARTFLVAQSMGGLTSLGFTMAYPERTLGLILGDTTGGVGDPTVLAALEETNPPAQGPLRSLSATTIERRPDLTFLYQQISGLNPERGSNGVLSSFRDPAGPQAADLAKILVPTLLIVGEEDVIFPVKAMQAVHRLIPGSRIEVVPEAAHSAHFEQPEVFNRLAGDFFAGVLSGKPARAG